jgi:hypothetical protein
LIGRVGWAIAIASMGAGAVRAQAADGGGRDVSVAMFSTRAVRAATVTPIGTGAWVARCERCPHEPLTAALHVTGRMDIFAGGTLRVTDDRALSAAQMPQTCRRPLFPAATMWC